MFHCTGLISPSTLLIGYYHSLLLRDIDADVLLDKMSTNGLIASHDQELISASHSNHQQNWLLLEHVRHMEMEELVKFCRSVEESYPQLGLQLVTGMRILCVPSKYVNVIYYSTAIQQYSRYRITVLYKRRDISAQPNSL